MSIAVTQQSDVSAKIRATRSTGTVLHLVSGTPFYAKCGRKMDARDFGHGITSKTDVITCPICRGFLRAKRIGEAA